MSIRLRQSSVLTTMFVTASFIFITLFGLNLSMRMDKMGHMSRCPLVNDQSSICSMSFADHMTKWQQLFTADHQLQNLAIFLSLLAMTFVYFIIRRDTQLSESALYIYRYHKQRQIEAKLFNPLQQAFSDGIIHPKLYK